MSVGTSSTGLIGNEFKHVSNVKDLFAVIVSLRIFLGSYEYSENKLILTLVTIFKYKSITKAQFCTSKWPGQALLKSDRVQPKGEP